jgi:hypothetical protein
MGIGDADHPITQNRPGKRGSRRRDNNGFAGIPAGKIRGAGEEKQRNKNQEGLTGGTDTI